MTGQGATVAEPIREPEEGPFDLVPCACSGTGAPSCPHCHDGNGRPTRRLLRGNVPSHDYEWVLEGGRT